MRKRPPPLTGLERKTLQPLAIYESPGAVLKDATLSRGEKRRVLRSMEVAIDLAPPASGRAIPSLVDVRAAMARLDTGRGPVHPASQC